MELTDHDPGLLVGDIILFIGIIPSTFFLIDYGILRWLMPRIRHTKPIEPWFDSLVGWLLFLLGLGFWAFEFVVGVQRALGSDFAGRAVFRDVLYAITTAAAFTLAIVWLVLKRRPIKKPPPEN